MARHTWGPLTAAGQAATADAAAVEPAPPEPPKKRRRTRWAQPEEQEGADADQKAIVLFPDKVVLSNGMQVRCPAAISAWAACLRKVGRVRLLLVPCRP